MPTTKLSRKIQKLQKEIVCQTPTLITEITIITIIPFQHPTCYSGLIDGNITCYYSVCFSKNATDTH